MSSNAHIRGRSNCGPKLSAFTLVELLVVIAIMAVLASLVVSAVSNATGDAANVIARQQQASAQQALNNYIASQTMGTNSLETVRVAYHTTADTDGKKWALILPYLDDSATNSFETNSGVITSDAMQKNSQNLVFSGWADLTTYPTITLTNN